MRQRELLLLIVVVAVCALAAHQQKPQRPPGEEGRENSQASQRQAVVGSGPWLLEFVAGRAQIRRKGQPQQVIWSRPTDPASDLRATWSPDGSHLALFQIVPKYRFTLWTPDGTRDYDGKFMDCDGLLQMAFSPDNRYLLLRVAQGFGAFDVDLGQLYSLDLKSGGCKFWEQSARKMAWRDRSHFTYWTCPDNQDSDADHWTTQAHQAHI